MIRSQVLLGRHSKTPPPFEGRENESDKGFKDVTIWESILAYKREHIADMMIVCSRDEKNCDKSLANEFRSFFPDAIFVKVLLDIYYVYFADKEKIVTENDKE